MQIAKNTVASFEYTLTDDTGEVIDTSKGRDPLAYLHGAGNIVPGLENEMEGKRGGDAFKVRVDPELGYGTRDDGMVQDVERGQFPEEMDIETGMQFQAETDDGLQVFTVVAVEEGVVRLDGNHPLAGVALNFEIKVVDVRAATAEELQHGHVHGVGGHHH